MDSIMNNKVFANELIKQPGWNIIIIPFIEEKIKYATNKLLVVSPKDVEAITKYQTTIKNYSDLLTYINKLTVQEG